jgi:hypothetical protein
VIEMLAGRALSDLLPTASLDLPERIPELLKSLDVKLSQDAIDMLSCALEYHPAKRPHVAGSFAAPLVNDLASDPPIGKG